MLPKKEIQKWIKALRSGRYKQGSQRLTIVQGNKKKLKHCCLGVLCAIKRVPFEIVNDTIDDKKVKTKKYKFEIRQGKEIFRHEDRSMVPIHWLPQGSTLARMNDKDGLNFNEIADYIEKEILPLAPE